MNGGQPSIAVLPFDNMSGDPSADSIADGVVEEITATLSRVRDFKVIARNSAYAYKGRAMDVREYRGELGVRYVLEGSLRKVGDRVRVTAQLIDAASGAHLWADSYDGMVDNLFDFEDEIAEQVAGAVHPSIREAEIALAKRKRPESLAAYDLVLRALPHLWAHRRATMPRPSACSTRRGGSIPATRGRRRSRRGRAPSMSSTTGPPISRRCAPRDGTDRSGGERGRRRSDGAHRAGDRDDAAPRRSRPRRPFRRPGAGARSQQRLGVDAAGFIDAYRGNAEKAIAAFEHAAGCRPLDPFSFNGYIGLGFANFALGRYDEAVQWAQRGMREKSGMTWAYRDLAVYLALAGRIDEAKEAIAELVATRPEPDYREVGEALRFIEPSLLKRYLDGLRIAGLPE